MRAKLVFAVMVFCLLALLAPEMIAAQSDDDLPDLCNSLLPRYEPQNRRLVLVDWTTGAEVRTLATDLDDTRILGWSLDCRFLAGAVGPVASMATTVWDAESGAEIGRVPDAHGQPHYITWGPGNFLVVETRSGAILWNVPANVQYPLTTTFNTTTIRNFSRLRWDVEHGQLLANLAVGGRAVYDLATGTELPVAANVTDSIPTEGYGSIVIGGKAYQCHRNRVPAVYPFYDIINHQIVMLLSQYDANHVSYGNSEGEVLQVVEADVEAAWFVFRGWSANCRYFAGSLENLVTGEIDTVVWDVTENRRVGAITGGHQIPHTVYWDTAGESLVFETRNGGYLWHLPTNTRVLLNANVETALDGPSRIRNFHSVRWDAARGEVLVVPIGGGHTVVVYDARTGEYHGVYPSGGELAPVSFTVSPDGRFIAVYHAHEAVLALWDRAAGTHVQLNVEACHRCYGAYYGPGVAFSPDMHYLTLYKTKTLVWDLWNLPADGTPHGVYEGITSNAKFIDNQTLGYSNRRLDITSGEVWTVRDLPPHNDVPTTSIPGESGPGQVGWGQRTEARCGDWAATYSATQRAMLVTEAGITRTLVANLNFAPYPSWSPDCSAVYAWVSQVDAPNPSYDNAPFDDMHSDRHSTTLVFWDSASGEQLRVFENPFRTGGLRGVVWSPGTERVLVQTSEGIFLWDRTADRVVLLILAQGYWSDTPDLYSAYWDYQRGQVLMNSDAGVSAFDMLTGLERYVFAPNQERASCLWTWSCKGTVSEDNTILTVEGYTGTTEYSVAHWNLDTFEVTYEKWLSHFKSFRTE